jgi:hypothetical protein
VVSEMGENCDALRLKWAVHKSREPIRNAVSLVRLHWMQSCFFMPCSPQSIKNEDYIYHLLAGALLFAGLEILPPAFRYLRRRYRENRLLFGMSPGRDI